MGPEEKKVRDWPKLNDQGKPDTPLNRASLWIDLVKNVDNATPVEEPEDPNNLIAQVRDALKAPGDMTVAEILEHVRFYGQSCLKQFTEAAAEGPDDIRIGGIGIKLAPLNMETVVCSAWLDGLMHGMAWMAGAEATQQEVFDAEEERAREREREEALRHGMRDKEAPEPHDDESHEPGTE